MYTTNPPGSLITGQSDPEAPALPSEVLGKALFPRRLTRSHFLYLTVLFIFAPLTPSSMIGSGGTALIFWIVGLVAFFIPSAVVSAKLGRMFPTEGAFYTWVHKALGPFWDIVLGFFCAWWAPFVVICATGPALIIFFQKIGVDLGQQWFGDPVQIIVAFLLVLALIWLLGLAPFGFLLGAIRWCVYGIGALMVGMVLVIVGWLLVGYPSQTSFSPAEYTFSPASLVTFTFVVSSLLGIQLPLNLAGEVSDADTPTGHIRASVVLIVCGYLITWLALAIILPQDPHDPLAASDFANVGQVFFVALGQSVFGRILSIIATLILCAYFILGNTALCLVQGRTLALVALDRRLPRSLALVRQEKPMRAFHAQMALLVVVALVAFGILPGISPDPDLPNKIAGLLLASSLVLWSLATLGLFLVGIILVVRYPARSRQAGGTTTLGIVFWAALGVVATLVAAVLAFIEPGVSTLSPGEWIFWLLLLVFAPLAVGTTLATLSPEPGDVVLFDKLLQNQQNSASRRRLPGD